MDRLFKAIYVGKYNFDVNKNKKNNNGFDVAFCKETTVIFRYYFIAL
jgi:hypothetical protein